MPIVYACERDPDTQELLHVWHDDALPSDEDRVGLRVSGDVWALVVHTDDFGDPRVDGVFVTDFARLREHAAQLLVGQSGEVGVSDCTHWVAASGRRWMRTARAEQRIGSGAFSAPEPLAIAIATAILRYDEAHLSSRAARPELPVATRMRALDATLHGARGGS